MADKSFGVKELNLLNASGTPTVTSPNNLNLNAITVAISTSCTIGSNLDVDGTTNLDNVDIVGITTIRNASGNKLYEGSANASKLFHNGSERLQTETYGIDINGTLGADQINCSGVSTITVPANANPHSSWDVVNNSASAYRFTGPGQDGAEDNPDIYLVRGQRYVFKMNASGHPFQIRVANGGAAYSDGVTNNGAQTGNVVFNVQHDAPAQLYYQCTSHGGMVGNIYIVGGPQVISGVVTATTFSGNLSGGTVSGTTGTFTNNLSVAQNIVHIGDTDTKIEFLTDTICFDTAGGERLRIRSNGNIGIGTDDPQYLDANFRELTISGGSEGAGLHLQDDNANVVGGFFTSDNTNAMIIRTRTNHPLMFRTNNVERLRIANDESTFAGIINQGAVGGDINHVIKSYGPSFLGNGSSADLTLDAGQGGGTVTVHAYRTSDNNLSKTSIFGFQLRGTGTANVGTVIYNQAGSSGNASFSVTAIAQGIRFTNNAGATVKYSVTFDLTGDL